MSLVTAFRFDAFSGDLRSRAAVRGLNGASLSLLSDDDVRCLSFVEVRSRIGRESKAAPWRPVVERGEECATLWDLRMGNFEARPFPSQPCATCAVTHSATTATAAANLRCPGHNGHITMPRRAALVSGEPAVARHVVYNPHLVSELESLMKAKCFFCHTFRASPAEVSRFVWALRLFDAGLVAEGLHLAHTNAAHAIGNKRGRDTIDLTSLEGYVARLLAAAGRTAADLPALRREAVPASDLRHTIVAAAMEFLVSAPLRCRRCGGHSPTVSTRSGAFYFNFPKKSSIAHNVDVARVVDQERVEKWQRDNAAMKRRRSYLPADDLYEHIRGLEVAEKEALGVFLPQLGRPTVPLASPMSPYVAADPTRRVPPLSKVFFLTCLPVPPLPLRMASGFQVQRGGSIVPDDRSRALSDILQFKESIEMYHDTMATEGGTGGEAGDRRLAGFDSNLRSLQLRVNEYYTNILNSLAKKEGLYRMNMMGKRVNQACRSVISPDVSIEPHELLLPRPFAKKMSFPEDIMAHPKRRALLRRCVVNGPTVYPGATHIEVSSASGEVQVIDLAGNAARREQLAERYIPSGGDGRASGGSAISASAVGTKKVTVYRHVLDGDRVVFNRQPTLHRPSMQGYQAKVLSGLRTIRFHYVNAKSFNADFDGDEMNVHLPQTIAAWAEIDMLMDADLQYILPTTGRPTRGMIQDHISAGVLLSSKDTFLTRNQMTELLIIALQPYVGASSLRELIPPPAILLPTPKWTGKQVVTAVVQFCGKAAQPTAAGASLRGTSAVSHTLYNIDVRGTTEHVALWADETVVFRRGALLVGTLCKNQLGPTAFSIAHVLHELYGPRAVGKFFGALGRALTHHLRCRGLSLGVDDMLLARQAQRNALVRQLDVSVTSDDEAVALSAIQQQASTLQRETFPRAFAVPYPRNSLVLMTQSGAKGSTTNAMQMAVVLGQQLFDGLRVGRMASGKTLPAHFAGERRARSFGFANGSFLTGIRPCEYTIHAMAGRDGLIDTAVKTARSGHLQRCLIKCLESLTCRWDGSVRDADGHVVQFAYGGDTLDPSRALPLTSLGMTVENIEDIAHRYGTPVDEDTAAPAGVSGKRARTMGYTRASVEEDVKKFPLPGVMHERVQSFAATNAACDARIDPQGIARMKTRAQKKGTTLRQLHEQRSHEWRRYWGNALNDVTSSRYVRARCDAGEPVGLLAAQAAGEPSTQMTLNTFHSAGSTVTHVTEGIPRLTELLVTASVSRGAVIIPVSCASTTELGMLASIRAMAMPTLLSEAMAVTTPWHWYRVQRTPAETIVVVPLIFSNNALERIRQTMRMTPAEHVSAFCDALEALGRSMMRVARGKRTRATRNVADDVDVAAPDDIAAKDSDSDASEGVGNVAVEQTPHVGPAGAVDDDGSSVSSLELGSGGEQDDDETLAAAQNMNENFISSQPTCTYASFSAMVMSWSGFKIEIRPAKVGEVSTPDVACSVAMITLSMPPRTTTVVPDMIKTALSESKWPTPLPQIESVKWQPSRDDATSGNLVFEGSGANLSSVLSFLAPFGDFLPSVALHRATSTDFRDILGNLGVEAAYRALFQELCTLFQRYSVDGRHLSLIADVATHRGLWESFSYNGMVRHSESPLFQMSCAASRTFLHHAITRGIKDSLSSVSSAVMVGSQPAVGTAVADVSIDEAALQFAVERIYGST